MLGETPFWASGQSFPPKCGLEPLFREAVALKERNVFVVFLVKRTNSTKTEDMSSLVALFPHLRKCVVHQRILPVTASARSASGGHRPSATPGRAPPPSRLRGMSFKSQRGQKGKKTKSRERGRRLFRC